MSELQRITDNLGGELGRSVAIDDRSLCLLAYSPHYGPVDEVRLGSILRRVAPEPQASWVLSQGIKTTTSPVRLPPNPELNLLARLCVPIIHRGVKMGFLWLIDADQSLTEQEIMTTQIAADSAAAALYREDLIVQLGRGPERELLRDLLASDPAVRVSAAHQLVDGELFTADGPVFVLVVRCGGPFGDEHARVRFDAGLTRARKRLAGQRAIHLTRTDHGVILISASGRLSRTSVQKELAGHVLNDIEKSWTAPDRAAPVVGIGEVQRNLHDAGDSYEQALQAARVGDLVRAPGRVARWAELGVYRTLVRLSADELTTGTLDRGVMCLLEADKDLTLIRTLETYLDLAGNIKRTSEHLNLHRTSLYYRLSRVEEIAGVDLHDGNDRLALHLGLKMARLAGLLPPDDNVADHSDLSWSRS